MCITITSTIRRAAEDSRINGLIANVSYSSVSPADAEEIHNALAVFKKAGKFTIAFADTFGEGGSALGRYYLASGFDEIWMQPSGSVPLIGVGAEVPFFKGSLDKLGIEPQFARSSPWKTGPNMFEEDGFTPQHEKTVSQLLDSIFDHLTTAIRQNRATLANADETLFLDGPYHAEQALELKLVDKLAYYGHVNSWAKKQVPSIQENSPKKNDLKENDAASEPDTDKKPMEYATSESIVPLATYHQSNIAKNGSKKAKESLADGQELALIFATGQIMRGPTADAAI